MASHIYIYLYIYTLASLYIYVHLICVRENPWQSMRVSYTFFWGVPINCP